MTLNRIEKSIYLLLITITLYKTLYPMFYDYSILLSSFTDDFYYYIKIAENMALGEGSTFNGIVKTNGYHPLWLIILTIFAKLSIYFNIEILIVIKILISFIIISSFFIFYSYGNKYLTNTIWRIFFVILSYYWYARFAYIGMEITITIPLFLLCMLGYLKNTNPLYLGLLSSLTILSRLDVIVIFAVFFCIDIFYRGIDIKRIMKLGVGVSLPILLYLVSNVYYFDLLAPISGMAKSVLSISTFHSATFIVLFSFWIYKPIFLVFYIFSIVSYTKLRNASIETRTFCLTAILSVPIYYLQTSLRSDWPIWPWYYYPLLLSLLMLALPLNHIFCSTKFNISRNLERVFPISVLIVMIFVLFFSYIDVSKRQGLNADPLHLAGIEILKFEKDHPGIYAMGDRAGVVGFLLDSPLIQLEGLVMDKNYLTMFEKSNSIEDVLNTYNVDYYVGTDLKKLQNNCFTVIEPVKSGGYSRKIESILCWKEVLMFKIGSKSSYILKNPHI